jgi:glycosyltransferase involved in cell wall biosynthesis
LIVVYVCNDLAYFNAHRRWLADVARQRGAKVIIACGGAGSDTAEALDIDFRLEVKRYRFDVPSDARLAYAIVRIAKQCKADVVHLITVKPVLFGAIGMRLLAPSVRIVCTFPGLGRIFDLSERSWKARLRRKLVVWGLTFGLGNRRSRAIFETADDREKLLQFKVLRPEQAVLVPGAGVDPRQFFPQRLPEGPLRLLFAGRLLKAKGTLAFADAASRVAKAGHHVEFIIAGSEEPDDPDALDAAELASLRSHPHVTLMPHLPIAEMPKLLGQVHAVVLPTTYQEGVPRILIEAGSVGRPAIVSNNPGCLAFVRDGENGIVLDEPDARHIADAAIALSLDRLALERMSHAALLRSRVDAFTLDEVADRTLALYA